MAKKKSPGPPAGPAGGRAGLTITLTELVLRLPHPIVIQLPLVCQGEPPGRGPPDAGPPDPPGGGPPERFTKVMRKILAAHQQDPRPTTRADLAIAAKYVPSNYSSAAVTQLIRYGYQREDADYLVHLTDKGKRGAP